MRAVAEQARVPMISLAASQKIVQGAHWVFKTPPNDTVVLQQLADYMVGKGYKRIGVLRDASAFGDGVVEGINTAGKKSGLTVVATESFAGSDTDFTGQLLKLRSAGTDANVIWGSAAAPALATIQYRSLGLTAPLLESYGVATPNFIKTAGTASEDVVLNGNKILVLDQLPGSDSQKTVLTKFATDYREAFGSAPTPFAGYAYDAMQLAGTAYGKAGPDRTALRDYLENLKDYTGVTGVFTFSAGDHTGLASSPLVMLKVSSGAFTLLPAS